MGVAVSATEKACEARMAQPPTLGDLLSFCGITDWGNTRSLPERTFCWQCALRRLGCWVVRLKLPFRRVVRQGCQAGFSNYPIPGS